MPYKTTEQAADYQAKYRQTLTPAKRHTYYTTFKNKRQKSWRKYMYKSLYGISQEQYQAMVEKQGGNCAICQHPPKPSKVLCVDHCHGTGKIRGLLCNTCNISIGMLGGITGLELALDYLKSFYRELQKGN